MRLRKGNRLSKQEVWDSVKMSDRLGSQLKKTGISYLIGQIIVIANENGGDNDNNGNSNYNF